MTNEFLAAMETNEDDWPWLKKARDELNEQDEKTTIEMLACLRQQINEYSIKHANFRPQMEEPFLMAFLRTRKFNVDDAFKAYLGFFKIRLCNPEKIFPQGKGPTDYRYVWEKPIGAALKYRNPIDGAYVMIWSFLHFDARNDQFEDIFNATLLAATKILTEPSVQTYGMHFIFDNTGLTFSIAQSIMSKLYLIKAMLAAQGSFPVRFKGFHVINEPYGLCHKIYYFIKPFLSKKMRNRVHFHGYDVDSLHNHISKEILPTELGGTAGTFSCDWLKSVLIEVNDEIVANSHYGFVDSKCVN